MVHTRTTPRCFGPRGLAADSPLVANGIEQDDIAAIARALAHPARVAIIERFADGRPKLTKDLVAPSGLAPSTMSEHLRILREAGLVVTRNDGPGVWYCLRRDRLTAFARSIDAIGRTEPGHERDSPATEGPKALPLFVE